MSLRQTGSAQERTFGPRWSGAQWSQQPTMGLSCCLGMGPKCFVQMSLLPSPEMPILCPGPWEITEGLCIVVGEIEAQIGILS